VHDVDNSLRAASGNDYATVPIRLIIRKLEVIFCVFQAENNFVNALILFIRARKSIPGKAV